MGPVYVLQISFSKKYHKIDKNSKATFLNLPGSFCYFHIFSLTDELQQLESTEFHIFNEYLTKFKTLKFY